MTPLSNLTYFRRSTRRVVPLVVIIVLAVVGVSVISIVTSSQLASARLAWLDPFRDFAIVQGSRGSVDPAVVHGLEASDDVLRVIPFQWDQTRATSLFGRVNVSVLGLEPGDMTWFMNQTGFRVKEGRLPRPGTLEIALQASIAQGRDVKVGDIIGTEVDDREFLRGSWEVVGILDGPVQLALAPKDTLRAQAGRDPQAGEFTYLVFPKRGRMSSLDAYITGLPRGQVSGFTYSSMNDVFRQEYTSARTVMWVIDLATIVVLSIATGLLNTIYFMQRMTEYGTLAALGYTTRFLARRALSEAMALTLVSWALGLLVAQILTSLLNGTLFASRGYSLHALDLQALAFTVPIPILIAGFSFVTVLRQFRRLDPITIIERRD